MRYSLECVTLQVLIVEVSCAIYVVTMCYLCLECVTLQVLIVARKDSQCELGVPEKVESELVSVFRNDCYCAKEGVCVCLNVLRVKQIPLPISLWCDRSC